MAKTSRLDSVASRNPLADWSVLDFRKKMKDAGADRVFVVHEGGKFKASHPKLLRPVVDFLRESPDFAAHEGIFIGREEGLETLFLAFVHDTRRGLAQGGVRFWKYANMAELLTDGLRLSQGMTRKNALAGLWWGGGKGIMPLPPEFDHPSQVTDFVHGHTGLRIGLFEAYGRFVAGLGGVYHAAEDIGVKTVDMNAIYSQNRFSTCISPCYGGSGNPSPHTARGVYRAIQAGWRFLTGADDLKGATAAVQGAGNVGRPLIEMLEDAGCKVRFSDVDAAAIEALKADRPQLKVVASDKILEEKVDILAPCARGAVLHAKNIGGVRARLICGAANNILADPVPDARRLQERGVLFIPDFVSNRMGIANCADEWAGYLEEDMQAMAERVYPDTLQVLETAQAGKITPLEAANRLADKAAAQPHPLMGHRGRRLIRHLVESGWHRQ